MAVGVDTSDYVISPILCLHDSNYCTQDKAVQKRNSLFSSTDGILPNFLFWVFEPSISCHTDRCEFQCGHALSITWEPDDTIFLLTLKPSWH